MEHGQPSILLQRDAEGSQGWKRLPSAGATLYSSDHLVSLPGYASRVTTDSNVRLVLQGLMREFSRDPHMDPLLESAVVLHKNSQVDADLTLDRGRVYLTNVKDSGPAQVRLRFGPDAAEVWDVTLREPGTEIGVDIARAYTQGINYLDGEEPLTEFHFMLLRGKAALKVDYDTFALDEPSALMWDNHRGRQGPRPFPADAPIWRKPPPERGENLGIDQKVVDEMGVALKELAMRLVGNKAPALVLEEMLHGQGTQPAGRRLAIYCMGSLDEDGARQLLDVLGDDDQGHAAERQAAIYTLRRWISRGPSQGKLLYDPKTQTGLLRAGQKYRSGEAKTLFVLLHRFSPEAEQSRETYELLAQELLSDKVAIAELAYWHLWHLTRGKGVSLPPFNAAAPLDERKPVAAEVNKLIADNKLPPRPQGSGEERSPGGLKPRDDKTRPPGK
jgi:hypothetical protein